MDSSDKKQIDMFGDVGWAWEGGIRGNRAQRNTAHLLEVKGTFTLFMAVMVTYMYPSTKTYQIVHFERVPFTVGQSYLSKDI